MAALIARLGVARGRLGRHLARRPHRHGARRHAEDRRSAAWSSTTSARASRSPRCIASAAYLRRAHPFATLEEVEAYLREIYAPFGKLTDAQWHHMAVHGVVQDKAGLRLHYDPAIVEQFSRPLLLDVALWRVWEHVACPVLILRGEHSDLLLPATVAEMTAARHRRRARPGAVRRDSRLRPRAGADGRRADPASSTISCLADDRRRRSGQRARGHRVKNKIVTTAEAIAIIRDGDTVAFSGFVGSGTPEELIAALERRFVDTGLAARSHARCSPPRPATARSAASTASRTRGSSSARSAATGASCRSSRRMAVAGKIEAYNLPLGTLTQLFRDIAGHRAGTLTKVGLRTFVDPRQQGGRINERTHRRPRARDGDRRRGVALLQGVSDLGGVAARHDRRPRRQHHDGARSADARQSRARDGRQELQRLRDRAGRARLRAGRAQSAPGAGSRRARRLRRRRQARASPSDLRHRLQSRVLRRAQGAARHAGADAARRAQGHRAPLRVRAADGRRGQPRHRHARRGGGSRQRREGAALRDADRRARRHRRPAAERSRLRRGDQHRRRDPSEPAVRLLRRRRARHGVPRHGAGRCATATST